MEPDRPEQTTALACCADLYQSDLARLLLGDSLHPGGLRLTHRLGALMGIQPDDWVVDLACGRGISGMAVSRTFRCKVAGIEYGAAAVADAHAGARDAAVPARAFFINADAGLPPIRPSSVDAVLCECSMSIFADQPGAIIQAARMLRPGGILGLSDVTVKPGSLPEGFPEAVGQALCLTGALDVAGYTRLVGDAGLIPERAEDASDAIADLLNGLEGKLGALAAWQSLAAETLPVNKEWLDAAPGILNHLRRLIYDGALGYWLFTARKPL
jgi:SAM-dependent methyltransferase